MYVCVIVYLCCFLVQAVCVYLMAFHYNGGNTFDSYRYDYTFGCPGERNHHLMVINFWCKV